MSLICVPVTCHCKSNTFEVEFMGSALPVPIGMCHCNQCRHSTGQLYLTTIPINRQPQSQGLNGEPAPAEVANLRQYHVTPRVSTLACRKCSAFMFHLIGEGGAMWRVFPGVLDRIEGIAQVTRHGFIADTCDGGVADFYRQINGIEIPRYRTTKQEGSVLPLGWKTKGLSEDLDKPLLDNTTLDLHCHCKLINLKILPPPGKISELGENGRYLSPSSDKSHPDGRYLANHCFCRSCRLTSGFTFTSRLFLPQDSVIDKRTLLPVVLHDSGVNKRMEGLLQYESSPGRFRESCAKCGARVFRWDTRRMNNILEVAAGLIDQEEVGSRAEKFFAWAEEPCYTDQALDEAEVRSLQEGLKELRTTRLPSSVRAATPANSTS